MEDGKLNQKAKTKHCIVQHGKTKEKLNHIRSEKWRMENKTKQLKPNTLYYNMEKQKKN